MSVLLLPLLGPLHVRWPALNVFTLRDILVELEPAAVATTVIHEGDLETEAWQDTFELALPLALVPWVRQQGLQLHSVAEPARDVSAQADFFRFAAEMPALQEKLGGYMSLENRLRQALDSPLNLKGLKSDILPLVREQQHELERTAGDGPATAWFWERAQQALGRISRLEAAGPTAVLASLEQIPALEQAARDQGVELLELPDQVPVSAEARDRTLLDQALLVDENSNIKALLEALEKLGSAEASWARANLLMANSHHWEALQVLEQAANGDFSQPYFLPGFLLARLGQLRDLDGNRKHALQAYRGVMALSWAPAEAVEVARTGLQEPFALAAAAG